MVSPDDTQRVKMLYDHAEANQLRNLRALCKVWLYADKGSEGKGLAEQKIRAWIDRGDPSKDASL